MKSVRFVLVFAFSSVWADLDAGVCQNGTCKAEWDGDSAAANATEAEPVKTISELMKLCDSVQCQSLQALNVDRSSSQDRKSDCRSFYGDTWMCKVLDASSTGDQSIDHCVRLLDVGTPTAVQCVGNNCTSPHCF